VRLHYPHLLARLGGDPVRVSLEQRLFTLLALVAATLLACVACVNAMVGLSRLMVVVPVVAGVLSALVYVLARRGVSLALLLWPFSLAMCSEVAVSWLGNGGSAGATAPFLVLAVLTFVPFARRWQLVTMLALYMAVTTGLHVIEALRPEMVAGYDSPQTRFWDELVSTLMAELALAACTILAIRVYQGLIANLHALRRRSEQRFREVADGIPVIVAEVDSDLRIRYCNRAGFEITGYGTADIDAGLTLPTVIHADDLARVREGLAALWEGAATQLREYRLTTRDGKTRDVLARAELHQVEGRVEGVRLYMVDITDRKRLESQYLQAQKMESIGMLAGGVAHDFNNVLTAIIGYARLIEMNNRDGSYGTPNAELAEAADTIVAASERASELVRKLLAFSRRGEHLQTGVFALAGVVDDVLALLRHSLDKRIEIVRECDGADLSVSGDRALLQSAVLNLCVNARDAMPEGGRLIAHVSACSKLPSQFKPLESARLGYARLSVSDTGVGMDEHVKQHLFEPFFTTKVAGKGTGLGLASVYGTVQNHGGHIEVRSNVGEGTEVTIYLPLCEIPRKLPAKESAEPARHTGGTVVVVDDEEFVRHAMAMVLQTRGYKVQAFADGAEAIAYVQQVGGTVVCAVVDMVMPRMNGRECIKGLRAARGRLPVISMSGYSPAEGGAAGLPSDVRILPKPFTPDALLRLIDECVEADRVA
jgi:two-component system, cell cycle sensor histidine kinase and response regulator CckA